VTTIITTIVMTATMMVTMMRQSIMMPRSWRDDVSGLIVSHVPHIGFEGEDVVVLGRPAPCLAGPAPRQDIRQLTCHRRLLRHMQHLCQQAVMWMIKSEGHLEARQSARQGHKIADLFWPWATNSHAWLVCIDPSFLPSTQAEGQVSLMDLGAEGP
jgi:hypothetical protein